MHPEIHFGYREHIDWTKKPLKELYVEMEELRKKVRQASGYTWDNSHFFINSIYGKPALQVLFSEDSLSFWNAETGSSMGSFEQYTNDEAREVSDWISHIEEHEIQCNQCKEWVKNKDGHYYSFTGFVCNKCYNPKVHLSPNTRGD